MKYLLLKNGRVVQDGKLISANVLIGNNRIIEIDANVKAPTPYSEVIDLSNKYLLPGLIHFNCPILKGDNNEPTNSAIYIALSHGSTFLIDTIKLKEEMDLMKTISLARESSKPIIVDYGFHLRALTCDGILSEDLIKSFVVEGITSYFIKWKDVGKLEDNHLEQIFMLAAKQRLLIICESAETGLQDAERERLILKNNPDKINKLLSIIRKYKCPFLFYGITTWEELDFIFANIDLKDNLFASVDINHTNNASGGLSNSDLGMLWKNPNVILSPPHLITPDSKKSHFIENSKSSSFLSDLICGEKKIDEDLMVKVCEMYATRTAKLLGIYPQKGILEPGADADIIVWNPAEPNIMKMRGTNTTLLRKDINTVIVNGKVISDEIDGVPYNLEGRYIFRNPIVND